MAHFFVAPVEIHGKRPKFRSTELVQVIRIPPRGTREMNLKIRRPLYIVINLVLTITPKKFYKKIKSSLVVFLVISKKLVTRSAIRRRVKSERNWYSVPISLVGTVECKENCVWCFSSTKLLILKVERQTSPSIVSPKFGSRQTSRQTSNFTERHLLTFQTLPPIDHHYP